MRCRSPDLEFFYTRGLDEYGQPWLVRVGECLKVYNVETGREPARYPATLSLVSRTNRVFKTINMWRNKDDTRRD